MTEFQSFSEQADAEGFTEEKNQPIDAEVSPLFTARDHRVKARSLLYGKKGLSVEEKHERLLRARSHLDAAISMYEAG